MTANVIPDRVLFDGSPTEPKALDEVVFQAVGAASACWENLGGAGVFESDRAKTIADEALEYVKDRIAEAWDEGWRSAAHAEQRPDANPYRGKHR